MARPPTLARRAATVLAALYVVALVLIIAIFRIVGERWWIVTVALYLPRIGFALPLPFVLLPLLATRSWRESLILLGTSIPLLLVLMGFVLPWPVSPTEGAPTVRLLSFNVDSGGTGVDHIVDEIDRFTPDIVFLQELGESEKIEPMMRARYPTVRVATQFLIASKFPITSSFDPDKVPYYGRMRSPRWLQMVIETPLGPIAFYCVHPLSPREGFYALAGHGLRHEIMSGQGFSAESEQLVKNNAGMRALQVAGFSDAAKQEKGRPVVIAGDTNLPGLSWILHRSLSDFQDGFTRAGWGFGYTFPTGRGPWMRIDRVLASDELRFVRFQVGHSKVSDHDCVVADLQRAP